MKTEVGYIQEKDYLSKPEPFYHKPKPVLVGDTYKLDWEECLELKAAYETKQAKEQKQKNMEVIITKQDPFLIGTYKGAIDYFRELYAANKMTEARAILTSKNIPAALQPIVDGLLEEFDKGE